jgi:hypothetical protein
MVATPAAAVLLPRLLVTRPAAAYPLHFAPVPRRPASISVAPPRRRLWPGPLRSLPPEGKMLGVALELRTSGGFDTTFRPIHVTRVRYRSSRRADGRGLQVRAVERGRSHVRPAGESRLAVAHLFLHIVAFLRCVYL